MKILKLFLLSLFVLSINANTAEAQLLKRLKRTAERAAENAVHRKVYQKTDEAVNEVLKDPEQREREERAEQQREEAQQRRRTSTESSNQQEDYGTTETNSTAAEEAKTPFTAYSKFDFIPGENIVFYENFERTAVGDFPTGWNTVGSAEIVNTNNSADKWLRISNATGGLVPMEMTEFPENFTLEFDLIHDIRVDEYGYKRDLSFIFTTQDNPETTVDRDNPGKENLIFSIKGNIGKGSGITHWYKKVGRSITTQGKTASIGQQMSMDTRGEVMHVALWRQGKRVRMYINERKVYDVPMAWNPTEPFKAFRLLGSLSREDEAYLIGNMRLAVGAPDTRSSKLITEGRLTTYGITFASNSADIQPNSYGTLKSIATVLQENPDLNINIIGHTDGDGDAAYNQQLSEQRAAAVKTTLQSDFGIAATRLTTTGKGETIPVADNATSAGKAQNRRVELVKR